METLTAPHSDSTYLMPADANFVAGQWMTSGDGTTQAVTDKYDGEVLSELPHATMEQMDQALAAASACFPVLRQWSAGKRAAMLDKVRRLLEGKREAFVELLIKEAGKPRGYAVAEINRCITTIKAAVAEATRFTGETVPIDYSAGEGKRAFTLRVPIGPIACITPFNFPLNLVLHKVAPALAVGCPVIVKPAPQAPLCALALAALIEEAGYPAGSASVMVCQIPVAEKLVTDPRTAMLSFTGSDTVGWHLKSLIPKKRVALELGGNAAVLVDADTDIERHARSIAQGSFLYAGQICISTQRIFVVESLFEQFKTALIRETESLEIGDPSEPGVAVGPLIDAGNLQRVSSWVEEAKAAGAEVLCGGHIMDAEHNLYAPTILTNTSSAMRVSCDEIFGPVVIVEAVKDFHAGLARINDSRFGLQAGVFTNRLDHARAAMETLEVGGVILNNIPGFRVDGMPYGGIKDSGVGREGLRYAMEEMTEPRLIVM